MTQRLRLKVARAERGRSQEEERDAVISDDSSRVAVVMVRAQEHWVIAQECLRVAPDTRRLDQAEQ